MLQNPIYVTETGAFLDETIISRYEIIHNVIPDFVYFFKP